MRLATMVAGGAALCWLVFRSGTKPSRLSYPCQQSAFATAAAAFGGPLVAAVIATRAGVRRFMRALAGKFCGGLAAVAFLVLLATASYEWTPAAAPALAPPADYHPDVFFVKDARGIADSSFGGVDDLVTLLGTAGVKLHRSQTVSLISGPTGLIDVDDVVLIKVNAQWAERGGTNTDVLRGVMRNIVEHPDGFTGEIIVADNGQSSGSLTRLDNNAEDHHQSPADVVADFTAGGFRASTYLWDQIRTWRVSEFAAGSYTPGYVVATVMDPETSIYVSYPKFTTAYGTHVSYKYGIWDQAAESYDAGRLVVINLPVLKTHSIYGVTASVKNHMGVITTGISTDSHAGVGRGGLGSVLSEVRMPDLTILDAVWVLARPGFGPSATYAQSSLVNQLAASRDPVALDAWAVTNILMPQIVANGYSPAQYANQNPDNPAGRFRQYLDLSMNELLLGGHACTNQCEAVVLHTWTGDADRDGDLDLLDFGPFDGCIGVDAQAEPACMEFDFDLSTAVDLRDFAGFQNTFTDSF